MQFDILLIPFIAIYYGIKQRIMKILVKFPTRGRSHFTRVLQRYQETRTTNDVHFLITIDKDDQVMNSAMQLNLISLWGNQTTQVIDPCGKIGAINYGVKEFYDTFQYDIIVLASDDMNPNITGWDQRIIDDMTRLYPDTDGVLWYNDGHVGRQLNTMCILGKKYFDRFGYIYQPDYKALWCDNEFMDVAEMLGKMTYSDDVIFEHQHPMWTTNQQDYLNVRDNGYYQTDKSIYEARKQRKFDLILNTDTNHKQPKESVQQAPKSDKPANRKGRPRKQSTSL